MEADRRIGLQEAADRLGVHYMTAYRYVRTGRLDATRVGGQWRVDLRDVAALARQPVATPRQRSASRGAAARRLEKRMLVNDEAGAWRIIEEMLASGAEPDEILVDLIAPAMADVGSRWEAGALSVADEHAATATAQRVVGRLGPRFARRGRKQGSVVIGAPGGELHALPVSLAADVLRGHGMDVVELGANTPAESFSEAAAERSDVRAIVVTVTGSGHERAVKATVRAVRDEGTHVPIIVGGSATGYDASTRRSGADEVASGDARALADLIDDLTGLEQPSRTR